MSTKFSIPLTLILVVVLLAACGSITPTSTENVITKTTESHAIIPEDDKTSTSTVVPTTVVPTTVPPTTAEKYSEVGYWVLTQVKENGTITVDEKDLKDYTDSTGYKAFIVFQKNHYGYINTLGDEQEFTWENGDAGGVKYTFSKDTLDLEMGNKLFHYVRSNEAPPAKGTLVTPDPDKADITETVLLDQKGVKITAKSISYDSWIGPSIKLLVENNSGKNLTVQCRNVSVNGFMVDPLMSVDVANGKKANDSLTFDSDSLKKSGIKGLAEIELSFHVFDTESWSTYLDSESIILKTNIADSYVQDNEFSGKTLFNENGIKIIALELVPDESFIGPSIRIYIENNTKKNIDVQVRNCSVNGFMIDPVISSEVATGKKIVDTIDFMESDLSENGISINEIKTVELSFHIFDSDSWSTIVDTALITIDFE